MSAPPPAERAGEGRESDSIAPPPPASGQAAPTGTVRVRATGVPPRPSRRTSSDGRSSVTPPPPSVDPPSADTKGAERESGASLGDAAPAAASATADEGASSSQRGGESVAASSQRGGEVAASSQRGGEVAASSQRGGEVTASSQRGGESAANETGEWAAYAAGGSIVGLTIEGRYIVEEIIGGGNIGLVYRARHKVIGKTVAIKLLRPDFARDHEVSERFLVEARAASVVDNPHVVDIGDFGALPDGTAYFVMEFLDGRPLSELIRDQAPLPIERIVHIGKQIASGLDAAHRNAIVHRDLKPDNLLVTSRGHETDFVTVVDFGIAKVAGAANRLTVAGTLYGTPHYMSPEQARGAEVDLRSDIYSLGVILYEMATGRVPFDADSPLAVISLHVTAEPVPPHVAYPDANVSPLLSEIIVRCLSKDPADRYASMTEVAEELDRALRWRPGALDAIPELFTPSSMRRAKLGPGGKAAPGRARWPLAASGLLAASLGAAALYQRTRPEPIAPSPLPPSTLAAIGAPSVAPSAASAEPSAAPSTDGTRRGATEVALVISPIDAHVYHQKVDLGTMPISIPVPSGDTVEVEIKREGFFAKKIKLDGAQPKRVIRLVPQPNPGAANGAAHGPEDAAKGETTRSPARAPMNPGPESGSVDSAQTIWPNEEPGLPALPPTR
ncbi:MAG: serine/threonine protein kinase [Polyangiaceae bacterium]|nr:serine/threonine protein kinase [Polyangiaceae bacterium]